MADDLTKWLSTPQAAQRAGVTRQMMNRLVRSGAIETKWTPLGRLIRPESLDRYISVREQRQERKAARPLPARSEAPVGA